MATATITGYVTIPASVGGANTTLLLGAPSITSSSTSGPTLTYTESSINTYNVPVGAPLTIPFGTISSADLVYVGSDQITKVIFNGGAEIITLAAGGFHMVYKGGITGMTVEPTTLSANVVVLLAEV